LKATNVEEDTDTLECRWHTLREGW
jgi:hypothetical protein